MDSPGSGGLSFQAIILALQEFWGRQGCLLLQPHDAAMGAGTFHPATALRAIGPGAWRAVHVQPCRRPADGRHGENPNRLQHYYQLQVILKPSPPDIVERYLESLAIIGIDRQQHDIRLVEDDWESPTLNAWGLGWEVWCDGMEITQFTYFQHVGGFDCRPVSGEITYGLERLAMYVQGCASVHDIRWNDPPAGEAPVSYGGIFLRNEQEFSAYNFHHAPVGVLFRHLDDAEAEATELAKMGLALPAYDRCLHASHLFNLLDARGALGVSGRAACIGRIRTIARACCSAWLKSGHTPA